MKVVKNVLNEHLYEECCSELEQLMNERCWGSNFLNWHSELSVGIKGSCLTTLTSDGINKKIEDDLVDVLPQHEKLDTFYYIWQYFSGISAHVDSMYKFGATIYLNPEWELDNGGIFVWKPHNTEDFLHNAILPQRNMMVLSDEEEKHLVTPLNFDAKSMRFTIQIWGS